MTLYGTYQDHLPRILLSLPRRTGGEQEIEFILDTGFDGYLTLPPKIAREIALRPIGPQMQMTADGRFVECPVAHITLMGEEEPRTVEVLLLGRNALLGTLLIEGSQLTIELFEGGEVIIED